MSKNFDETVRLYSKKRSEERDCRRLRSSLSYQANSSAALLPGKNECPGTYCSLIIKEREDCSCEMNQRV